MKQLRDVKEPRQLWEGWGVSQASCLVPGLSSLSYNDNRRGFVLLCPPRKVDHGFLIHPDLLGMKKLCPYQAPTCTVGWACHSAEAWVVVLYVSHCAFPSHIQLEEVTLSSRLLWCMTFSLNPHLSQTLDDRIRGGLLIQGNIPEAWPGSYDNATQQEEMSTANRIPLLASELRHNNSKKFSAAGPEAKCKHRHRAGLGVVANKWGESRPAERRKEVLNIMEALNIIVPMKDTGNCSLTLMPEQLQQKSQTLSTQIPRITLPWGLVVLFFVKMYIRTVASAPKCLGFRNIHLCSASLAFRPPPRRLHLR